MSILNKNYIKESNLLLLCFFKQSLGNEKLASVYYCYPFNKLMQR